MIKFTLANSDTRSEVALSSIIVSDISNATGICTLNINLLLDIFSIVL